MPSTLMKLNNTSTFITLGIVTLRFLQEHFTHTMPVRRYWIISNDPFNSLTNHTIVTQSQHIYSNTPLEIHPTQMPLILSFIHNPLSPLFFCSILRSPRRLMFVFLLPFIFSTHSQYTISPSASSNNLHFCILNYQFLWLLIRLNNFTCIQNTFSFSSVIQNSVTPSPANQPVRNLRRLFHTALYARYLAYDSITLVAILKSSSLL